MDRLKNYFICQWKRIAQVFPFVAGMTLLFTACLLLLASAMQSKEEKSDRKQKVEVGVVGDMEQPYLRLGLVALQQMDTMRYTIDFKVMSRKEASEKLEAGKLSAYIVLPDDFVERFNRGEEVPILYATSNDGAGLGTILLQELVPEIDQAVAETQKGIMGVWNVWTRYPIEEDPVELTDNVCFQYINIFLDRTKLYDVIVCGWGNELSLKSYYFVGLLILYLLLWGITSSSLFIKRDWALCRVLQSRGLGIWKQILAEYTAYLLLMLGTMFLMILPLQAVFRVTGLQLPEWEMEPVRGMLAFFCKIIPAAAVIAALQFFLYEVISDMISGVLLQFIVGLGLGYLSGCLYPVDYFPESIQRFAYYLPSGTALQYGFKCIKNQIPWEESLILTGYLCLFLGLAVWIRKRRTI